MIEKSIVHRVLQSRPLIAVPCILLLAACSSPAARVAGVTGAAATPSATVAVPAATPEPTAAPTETATPPWGCDEPKGTMVLTGISPEEVSMMSYEQGLDLTLWPVAMRVYLPPCYDPGRERGYPLLIMIHGQTYNYDQWDRDGMDEKADELISAGQIQPLIIAMPNEYNTDRDPKESDFDRVVIYAALPWLDGHYHTCTERFCRAVGGLSRGATWAVHIGFLHPEVFGSIGAHSFTPFIGDVYNLKYWMMHTTVQALPRFYLDMGSGDKPEHIEAIDEYRAEMDRLGIPYEWHWNTGGHDDAYWSAHVGDYLRWYSAAWKDLPV
jgi:enterochelin esterase-like enzyme